MPTALVHLGAGIGNIVLATPLLQALEEMCFVTDVVLSADYPATEELFHGWSAVRAVSNLTRPLPHNSYTYILPAIPPFYWRQYHTLFRTAPNVVARPPDSLFYADEQAFYLSFAYSLGYDSSCRPAPRLPICGHASFGVSAETVVLAPGCKTGEMAFKRWPHFPELAARLSDVAVVGTIDDLRDKDGRPLRFPPWTRCLAGQLTLRETAEVLAASGVAVANDSGLGHIAAAVGVPTVLIFGPTPHLTLGPLANYVKVLRRNLPCEPCWFGERLGACGGRAPCLGELTVDDVLDQVSALRSRS